MLRLRRVLADLSQQLAREEWIMRYFRSDLLVNWHRSVTRTHLSPASPRTTESRVLKNTIEKGVIPHQASIHRIAIIKYNNN